MKKLLLALLLIPTVCYSQVMEQRNVINGVSVIRLVNSTPYFLSCYYQDEYNYLTFTLAPNQWTGWQPVYGAYSWECR